MKFTLVESLFTANESVPTARESAGTDNESVGMDNESAAIESESVATDTESDCRFNRRRLGRRLRLPERNLVGLSRCDINIRI